MTANLRTVNDRRTVEQTVTQVQGNFDDIQFNFQQLNAALATVSGIDVSNLTDTFIPMFNGTTLVNSPMSFDGDTITSTANIVIPDNSAFLGPMQISNAAVTLVLTNTADSNAQYFAAGVRNRDTGSDPFTRIKTAARGNFDAQTDRSVLRTVPVVNGEARLDFQFSSTISRYNYAATFDTPTGIQNGNLIVSLSGFTDTNPIYDWNRVNGSSEGYDVAAGTAVVWPFGGQQTGEEQFGQLFRSGMTSFVSIVSDTEFQIRGVEQTPGDASTFIPYFLLDTQEVTFPVLFDSSNVTAGTGTTITDNGDGTFTISSTGGGGASTAANVSFDDTGRTGILLGANDVQEALDRIDATGIGALIFQFTGAYSAQNSNISEWFGDRQLIRMRCTDSNIGSSASGVVPFDLPGTTALNTAFDRLVTLNLPEIITFIIEYTGPSKDRLVIRPRSGGPQIGGVTNITVRDGVAATIEITRSSGTISDYVFRAIGGIGGTGSLSADAIKLINPAVQTWDASANGPLPTSGVNKGDAYRVVNAPADMSGRFGEVMQNGDWVIWEGETFTSWATTPHQWSVLAAHDVRRISALESEFLNDVAVSETSDRNGVIRGANYADQANEIRMKIYPTAGDYDAADLNTTGIVDQYTNASNQTGRLAIRLPGLAAANATVLPTLYVYSENSGTFTRIINLQRDFNHQGDFSTESDYLSVEDVSYTAGETWRIYVGTLVDRYNSPNLDVSFDNLLPDVQAMFSRRNAWESLAAILFSGAVVRDDVVADRIDYSEGYSRGVDWRDQSAGVTINDNRYIDSDLTITQNGAASFEVEGFGVGLRKLVLLGLQRNDSNNAFGAMMEIAPGEAFIRVNASNEVQVNTTPGSSAATWVSLDIGSGNITLSNTANNRLLFEIVPIVGSTNNAWEVVGAFFDGTSYHQLNNITFIPTSDITGDHHGFSRSVNQRGQVTRFSAIKSPSYLTHAELEDLLRHHVDDKWNMGYARLIEGSTTKEIIFKTRIGFEAKPSNTEVVLIADDTDTANIKLGVEEA